MLTRVYLDTSAIGGCLDEEFSLWSKKLFREFETHRKIAVISDLTLEELRGAPQSVKVLPLRIPEASRELVQFTDEAETLSKEYIRQNVVSRLHLADAQHIAIATVEKVDVLVSWNFKQIVNLNKIHQFNAVNLKLGYRMLEIRSPREVLDEKEV
ncbi:MAG: PIN domain protein [Candidatus Omnitrophica bacterium]|nr:PIN domain protein [Candidatus Omnitrophota bacterium]